MQRRGVTKCLTSAASSIVKAGGCFAAYVCLSVMLTLMIIDPVMRYLVGSPFFWSNEVSTTLMVVMFFTALGITLVTGKHVRVTVIFNILPRVVQNVLWVILSIAGLFYGGFLLFALIHLTASSFDLGVKTHTSEMLVFPWQLIGVLGVIVFVVAMVIFTVYRIAYAFGIREQSEDGRERGAMDPFL